MWHHCNVSCSETLFIYMMMKIKLKDSNWIKGNNSWNSRNSFYFETQKSYHILAYFRDAFFIVLMFSDASWITVHRNPLKASWLIFAILFLILFLVVFSQLVCSFITYTSNYILRGYNFIKTSWCAIYHYLRCISSSNKR